MNTASTTPTGTLQFCVSDDDGTECGDCRGVGPGFPPGTGV